MSFVTALYRFNAAVFAVKFHRHVVHRRASDLAQTLAHSVAYQVCPLVRFNIPTVIESTVLQSTTIILCGIVTEQDRVSLWSIAPDALLSFSVLNFAFIALVADVTLSAVDGGYKTEVVVAL